MIPELAQRGSQQHFPRCDREARFSFIFKYGMIRYIVILNLWVIDQWLGDIKKKILFSRFCNNLFNEKLNQLVLYRFMLISFSTDLNKHIFIIHLFIATRGFVCITPTPSIILLNINHIQRWHSCGHSAICNSIAVLKQLCLLSLYLMYFVSVCQYILPWYKSLIGQPR